MRCVAYATLFLTELNVNTPFRALVRAPAAMLFLLLPVLPAVAEISVSIDVIGESGRFMFDYGGILESADWSVSRRERDRGSALRVLSEPGNAEVHLNRDRIGRTPQEVSGLSPGIYLIRVERSGYYPASIRVTIGDRETVTVDVRLTEATGLLVLDREPRDTEVLLDGSRLRGRYHDVREGSYRLEARRFGYVTERRRIRVIRNRVTEVSIRLREAPFELSRLSVSRPVFRPKNPPPYNTTAISFRADAPGTAKVFIFDPDGSLVRELTVRDFRTWDQRVTWDGRDERGRLVDPGEYEIVVEGESVDAEERDSVHGVVTVSEEARISYRTAFGGSPGLLYAAEPVTLPARAVQMSLLAGGRAIGSPAAPLHFGARFGTGPVELSAGVSTILGERNDRTPTRISGAVDVALSRTSPLRASLRMTGNYQIGEMSTPFGPDEPVLRFQAPLRLDAQPLGFVMTPGVALDYDGDPRVRPELESAIILDYERVVAAISARSDSRLITDPTESQVDTGAETHVLIPGTPLYVSAWSTLHFSGSEFRSAAAGGGLGVLW